MLELSDMSKSIKDFAFLSFITFTLTLLIWLPHILALPNFWGLSFKEGFSTIYRNFDGLEYIVIAKTFYDPQKIAQMPQSLPANYYAAHFPGFSFLIRIIAPLFGYLKSMLFVSLMFTIFSVCMFYLFVKDFKLTDHPLFLSLLFLILPARWIIVHSVGSAEPLFIFFVLLSVYGFMKFEQINKTGWIWLAAFGGVGAQLTRPPAILLAVSYSLYIHYMVYLNSKHMGWKKAIVDHFKYLPLLLIPLTLVLIFYMFQISYNDFWAYFHSGDNIHLTLPPFQVFNKHQFWVGDIWLEDIVYIFILGFLGGITLLRKKLYPLAFFVLTYLTASTLIAHRDISRYVLPIAPFVLIAFEKALNSREFKIILPIILFAVYLYTQNFLLQNVAPFSNLQLFN